MSQHLAFDSIQRLVKIGTTVVVTGDSLQTGAPGAQLTLIESDRPN